MEASQAFVTETFADIEDEFCDNNDYVEVEEHEVEFVTEAVEDDGFEWPESREFDNVLDFGEEEEPEMDGEKNIECIECEFKTNRRSNYNRHIKTVHNLVRHACNSCDKYFTDRCSLARHVNSVHQKVSFECDSCTLSFTRMSNLKAHIRASHMKIKLKCPECEYNADTNQTLKRHIEAKHSNRTYICSVNGCDFRTGSKIYLKGHFSHVHEKSAHICKEPGCDYTSMTDEALKHHVKAEHLGVRVTCTHCGLQVRSRSSLLNHIRVVHMNLIQVCKICGYKCRSKSELNVHNQAEHLGIIHSCEICEYTSKRKAKLNNHIKSVHEGVRYNCTELNCGFQATTSFNLKRHVGIVHRGERVSCKMCDYSTSQMVHMKKHMAIKHINMDTSDACNNETKFIVCETLTMKDIPKNQAPVAVKDNSKESLNSEEVDDPLDEEEFRDINCENVDISSSHSVVIKVEVVAET